MTALSSIFTVDGFHYRSLFSSSVSLGSTAIYTRGQTATQITNTIAMVRNVHF